LSDQDFRDKVGPTARLKPRKRDQRQRIKPKRINQNACDWRGRPDLVAKILIAQIPPYWLALYLAMHAFGLIGCAMVFLARLVVDYVLQSWVSDHRIAGWRAMMRYAALLGGALLWSQALSVRDPRWWAGTPVFIGLTLFCAWRELQPLVRTRLSFGRTSAGIAV